MAKLTVKCPGCSKTFDYYSSKFRPFCSDRCKTGDLANWAAEKYKISRQIDIEDDSDIELPELDSTNITYN